MSLIMFHAMPICNKKFIILFLLLMNNFVRCSLLQDTYSVVFIHVGEKIPDYLLVATGQVRLFNPDANIIVVSDQKALNNLDQQTCRNQNLVLISCQSLAHSKEHIVFKKNTKLPHLREGFWIKATERFFYLDELIATYDLKDVFHMEYDNMLYVNLTSLLPIFHHYYPNMGATFDNDNRCIPGFVYCAHAQGIKKLTQFIAQMASKGRNDMEIIALFKKNNSSDSITNLPIIMPEYLAKNKLKTSLGHIPLVPGHYFLNIDEFKSIFDAAALGQFLGGIDPRLGKSVPGFINESCLFNSSLLTYEWHHDEMGRKIPYAIFDNQRYRINNLHIHSKKLSSFAS